jgi:putative ABC transport system permease protein
MAFRNLGRRKVRTALTVSGIVVGISMTFIFLSMIAGVDVQIASMVRSLGGADITIYNATITTRQQILLGTTNALNEALVATVDGVSGVYAASPELSFQGYLNGTRTLINGIDPETYSLVIGELNMIEGSSLGGSDEAVLGKTIADSLNATIGGDIILGLNQVGGQSYRVVGIYETGIAFQDRGCYVDLNEAQNISNREGLITAILVKCVDPNEVSSVSAAITNLIPNVRAVVPTNIIQQVSNVLNTVRLFFLSIGVIALMAGSFGVVNTMITSISERTREIGTLKAMGARDGQILKIFLSEALLLGALGGAVGVSLGIVISMVLPMFLSRLGGLGIPIDGLGGINARAAGGASISPAILPSNILLCFSLGIIVGVLAGLYPAWRAARMRPVEALRRV